ncbi:MAG: Ig-like domain-containing protein [Nocardioides sp.]
MAFVSEDQVRFKAEAAEGVVRLGYTARDDDGNFATGRLAISINPLSAGNSAPQPVPLTVRTVEESPTEIRIPLDGIDPDGDTVTLVGLDSAPELGTVTVDPLALTYAASRGQTGVDTFSYLVEDRFGEQARGLVRVGVAPKPSMNHAPVPVVDETSVRPGRLVGVPVTVNDIDPEGTPLALVSGSVEPIDKETSVKVVTKDGLALIDVPTDPEKQTLQYYYDVIDAGGRTATGELHIDVDPSAPLKVPVARDDVVPLNAIVGHNTVDVDALDNDEDSDGAVTNLDLQPVSKGLSVTQDGLLNIAMTKGRQVLIYSVTDEDDQTAYAAVIAPGLDSMAAQRPVLAVDAPIPVHLKAGANATIDLAKFVSVRDGREPSIQFSESVQAGPGWNGSKLLNDPATVSFGSDADFLGLTAVTFEVTDAKNDSDDKALTAVITVPIIVEPNGTTQPTFEPYDLTVAAGEAETEADLAAMTQDPDPGDLEKMSYSLVETPTGYSAGTRWQRLEGVRRRWRQGRHGPRHRRDY